MTDKKTDNSPEPSQDEADNKQSFTAVVVNDSKSKSRPLVVGLVIVLLVAVAGTGYYLWKTKSSSAHLTAAEQAQYARSLDGTSSTPAKRALTNSNSEYTKNYNLGMQAVEDGDAAKAITYFEAAASAPGDKPYDFYATMASTYASVGNKAKAVESEKMAKQVYNQSQAKIDSPETAQGINSAFDQQILDYSQ